MLKRIPGSRPRPRRWSNRQGGTIMRFLLVSALVAVVAIVGCKAPVANQFPAQQMMMGPGPGIAGPGPGVIAPEAGMYATGQSSQVSFKGPEGMVVTWDVGGAGMFDSDPLICPGSYNFPQGAIYRFKLTSVPGRPGVELYPTLEVGPSSARTQAFLAHNTIPVVFSEEDFDQVLTGNFVTKVIYLPDPEFQDLALAGADTLVSTRLDPGVDPIIEADRRGAIMAILRLGNKDLEIPGEPVDEGTLMPVSYSQPLGATGGPMPANVAVGGMGTAPGYYISGVTGPHYGIPMTETAVGLPGAPFLPTGTPAGGVGGRVMAHVPKPNHHMMVGTVTDTAVSEVSDCTSGTCSE